MIFGKDQKTSNPELTGAVSMLPLVDILFSSAGIFLILISIIHILQTQINIPPPTAEMAVVCADNSPYLFFTQADHQGIAVYSHEAAQFIEARLRQREDILPLLVAFDAEAFHEKDRLMKTIRAIGKKRMENGEQRIPPHVETMLWPLAESGELPPIILKWQKDAPYGHRSR